MKYKVVNDDIAFFELNFIKSSNTERSILFSPEEIKKFHPSGDFKKTFEWLLYNEYIDGSKISWSNNVINIDYKHGSPITEKGMEYYKKLSKKYDKEYWAEFAKKYLDKENEKNSEK